MQLSNALRMTQIQIPTKAKQFGLEESVKRLVNITTLPKQNIQNTLHFQQEMS